MKGKRVGVRFINGAVVVTRIRRNVVLLSTTSWSSDCYQILQMAGQLCCHNSAQIQRFDDYASMELRQEKVFVDFEPWKLVKWHPSPYQPVNKCEWNPGFVTAINIDDGKMAEYEFKYAVVNESWVILIFFVEVCSLGRDS